MTNTTSIVLLGGSGLGPWAWRRVIPILGAHGFRTTTPQLRATGDDPTPAEAVSLRDWVDDLLAELAGIDSDDITLVAHSFAGYVAAAALERDPTVVRTVIFLDAALPTPGSSWFDVAGPQTTAFMMSLATSGAIPFFTRPQLDQLHRDHGITDSDWAWMEANLTAQPVRTLDQPAIGQPLDSVATRLAYVRCLRVHPPTAELDDAASAWALRTLPTGHWPMITAPEATAAVIEELVRG